jgi:hypothetical protein
MSMHRICATCKWFNPTNMHTGWCNLNPPAVSDSLAAYQLEKIRPEDLEPPEGFRPEHGKGGFYHQVRMFKVAEAASVRPVVRQNDRCSHYEPSDKISAPRD